MTVVTPTDRPKSVRNRCVIEVFAGGVFVLSICFRIFCWYRGLRQRSEFSFFFSLIEYEDQSNVETTRNKIDVTLTKRFQIQNEKQRNDARLLHLGKEKSRAERPRNFSFGTMESELESLSSYLGVSCGKIVIDPKEKVMSMVGKPQLHLIQHICVGSFSL